jgi:hypothetical protein
MKRKLIWLTAIGAVMALAYAQSVTIRGAIGFGLAGAPDAERPNAQFNFSVKQASITGRADWAAASRLRCARRTVSCPSRCRTRSDWQWTSRTSAPYSAVLQLP